MDRFDVRVRKLVQGGDGFAVAPDGRAMFIAGALPGELVSCALSQEKKNFLRAEVLEVLEPSPDRVVPACPYYGRCGGCNLMHLASASQASAKRTIVFENLRRIGGFEHNDSLFNESNLENGSECPSWGYRSRARFHVDAETGTVGFLGSGGTELVDIRQCPVLVPSLETLLDAGRDKLVRQARASVSGKTERNGKSREERRSRFSGIVSQRYAEIPVFAGDSELSFGSGIVHAAVAGKVFSVDSSVFFQSNRFVLPGLVAFVMDQVVGPRVMDLYSGVGTFSAFLEKMDLEVVAVERDPRCLELARRNLVRTDFFTGEVERWGVGRHPAVDTVVVDPPRVGLDAEVPRMIASWRPERIVYVSCDSVTLARDLRKFIQRGYSPVRVKVFDFYPQTFHQETVLVLDRG